MDKDDPPLSNTWESQSAAHSSGSDTGSFVDLGPSSDVLSTDIELAAHASDKHEDSPIVELYDSGTTRHISPYKDRFETLSPIPPKPFIAANKQCFNATGIRELVIEVPNGVDSSKLCLTEVLYSPEVGYTLVSIGRLDKLGYSTTFADGMCIIRGSSENIIGAIAKMKRGLYCVVHDGEGETANATDETITMVELHRCMGHIAPSAARCLAENGLVSGVKVDMSSGEPTFCESCVYAKATRKPVAKVRQGERAAEFVGEVHTDLWGPSPMPTLGGRRYYISFTDDKT